MTPLRILVRRGVVGYVGLFADSAVGAVDGVFAGGVIPRPLPFNGIPLCRGTLKVNARQAAATGERITANAGHAVRNDDARQAAAIRERTLANAGHTVRNGDARQAAATGEHTIANAGHAVRDGDAR